MNKKIIFAILCCLVLGAGVFHASSGDADQTRAESATPMQLDLNQLTAQDDNAVCLTASEVASDDLAIGIDALGVTGQAAGYECPPFSSYCQQNRDCDQANGEVCQNGCCYAAF